MRKMFLFAAAAMVSLSSCVQTYEVYTDVACEMGFKSAVTRSVIENNQQLTVPIAVSAVLDNVVEDGTPVDSYIPYFTNDDPRCDAAKFVYNDSGKTYSGDPARYWPSSGDMYFLAFCPYPSNASLKTNYNATTGKIDNMTITQVDNNIVNQHDILYSDLLKVTAPKSEPQSLLFHHALTQINVTFKKTDSSADVIVNSVLLEDVFFAGTLVITPNEGAASTATWSTPGPEFSKSRYFNKDLNVSGIEDNTLDEHLASDQSYAPMPLLIIPQANQSKFLITYTIAGKTQTYECDLTANGEKWEMGKKYTYNFTINVDEIIFRCTVDDWVPGNSDGVNDGESVII